MPFHEWSSLFFLSLSALFVTVDPIGLVPILLSMTKGRTKEDIASLTTRACRFSTLFLIGFAIFGTVLFQAFGLKLSAFRAAGGGLLLMTAFEMLKAKPPESRTTTQETEAASLKQDFSIIPLSIPLMAGPGAMTTTVAMVSKSSNWIGISAVLCAIVSVFTISLFVFRSANLLQRVLKTTGLAVLERIMGLILATLAVQFIVEGVGELFFSMRPGSGV